MTNIVFLPGMMCDARLFEPQTAFLLSALPQTNVTHPAVADAPSINEMAEAMLLQTPDTFALLGLSMGGIIAMEMLRLAPERIERLALLDTNALADPDETKTIRNRQIKSVENGKLMEIMRDELKPNYLADGPNRRMVLDLCMEMAMDLGPEIFTHQAIALRDRRDQRDTLKNCRVPALVLHGEHDQLCSAEKHQIIADALPACDLTVIADAGHLPTLENPDATNEALLKWLTTH